MDINEPLEIKVGINILKPVDEVFKAIVDDKEMSQYFISKSSGRMEEGKTLDWQFPEMDMKFPVRVHKIDSPDYISFFWDDMDGTETHVEMRLKPTARNTTFISVTEGTRENNEEGINWLKRNTEGWANFLACLKAYKEYGINLRKGAFDASQMPEMEGKGKG